MCVCLVLDLFWSQATENHGLGRRAAVLAPEFDLKTVWSQTICRWSRRGLPFFFRAFKHKQRPTELRGGKVSKGPKLGARFLPCTLFPLSVRVVVAFILLFLFLNSLSLSFFVPVSVSFSCCFSFSLSLSFSFVP